MELTTPWRQVLLLYLAEIVLQGGTKYLSPPEVMFIYRLMGGRCSIDDKATSDRLRSMPIPPGFDEYCLVVLKNLIDVTDNERGAMAVNNAVAFAILTMATDDDYYEKIRRRIGED